MKKWILKLKYKFLKLLYMKAEDVNIRLVETENCLSKISIIIEALKTEKVFDNDLLENVSSSLDYLNKDVEVLRRTYRRKLLNER